MSDTSNSRVGESYLARGKEIIPALPSLAGSRHRANHREFTRNTVRPNRIRFWDVREWRSRRRAVLAFGLPIVLSAALLSGFNSDSANAADPCGSSGNQITCENSKPGTDPYVWDIDGSGDPSIQGFATDISVNVGNRIDFKIDTNARNYSIDIYRTGWYQGLGARKVASVTPSANLPQSQPQCISDITTELYDCGTWGVSASWNVPSTAVSGVYLALLTRADTGGQSHIMFIVRDLANHSDVLFQTSDPTWHAYNIYGGADFYQGSVNGRAYKISYNRPFATRGGVTKRDFYFGSEYPAVRFLEQNGYDVSYFSGVDTDRFGSALLNHKVILSVGHDEYWSGAQRANVMAARDAGVNLQFLSGNEMYWRTRYEPSADTSATPYRTLVSYKETWSNAKVDPSAEWTGTWRDPRFASSANGAGQPENGTTGTMYMSNFTDLPVTVTAEQGKMRLWRNTTLSSLASGSSAALAPHTVGYESNEDIDNGFRPAGLIRLSTTVGAVPEYLQDFGNAVAPGTTTHHVTLYRAPSGALVFSAGSVQWTWGLDQEHDGDGAAPDSRMRQAQVNLLADMGAQPSSLVAPLVAAIATTDSTAPQATIQTPASGSSVSNGSLVIVSGTASDAGGRVSGVEVSTDGGTSWHPATGTTSWTYRYYQQGSGTQSIQVRAIDDSGNYPAAPASRSLTVTGPFSVFGQEPPAASNVDSGDSGAVEVGLRFTPSVSGFINGVRFFKSTANIGSHTGSLWDNSGTLLATVAFTNESASGWQSATFTSAVAVTAGQSYVVSYSAPKGHYSATTRYWSYRGRDAGPLTVGGGFGAPPTGLFAWNLGTFPTQDFQQTNYFVDALFSMTDSSPIIATNQTPVPGGTSVPTGTVISATMSRPVVASSVVFTVKTESGNTVSGATSYNSANRTATFTPAAALAVDTKYNVNLVAADSAGATLSSGGVWSFTTAKTAPPAGACPCSLFDDTTVPEILDSGDPNAVTLGVRFTAENTGTVSGVKFYKAPGNTGVHVGSLWSASGTLLASATFTGESSAGWQSVNFSSPVTVTAGTEYTAAYRTSVGHYSVTTGTFSGGYTRDPLAVPSNGGSYSYADAYPNSRVGTNYLVDVIYQPTPVPFTVVSLSPANGTTDVDPATAVRAVLSTAVANGYQLTASIAGTPVAGAVTLSSDRTVITFLPSASLPTNTKVDVTLSNLSSTTGSTLPPQSWSFTTAVTAPVYTNHSLFSTQTPAVPAATNDSSPVELGMSFSASVSGSVTAIRFYKGTGNTGTHTGSLWSSTGQRLATVTFTGETATGWQSAQLTVPVELTAGQTYVVSYFAPNGRYAYTTNFFQTPLTNGPLTAGTATNGRYLYGSSGGFPNSTWQASNYFVDVVFAVRSTAPPAVTVTSTTPAAAATGVATNTPITAELSAAPSSGTPAITVASSSGNVAGTSAYNSTTRVVSFTPAASLAAETNYTAVVAVAGTPLSGGTWSFTTASAPPPPPPPAVTVTSTTPAADATGVATNTPITAQLSAVPSNGPPTLTLATATGAVAGASSFNPTTRVVSFAPSAGLATATNYTATVSVSGTPLASGTFSFTTAAAPPPPPPPPPVTVTTTTPAAGASGVDPTLTITAQLSAVPSATPALSVTSPAGSVAGTSAYDAATRVVSFTPSQPLAWAASHTATVTIAGATPGGGSWSFTTVTEPPSVDALTIFAANGVPDTPSWNDTDAVQVGVRFSSSVAGSITGIRFYKGTQNSGTHTGYLWSSTGTLLATVNFTAETASGWQSATFNQPVTIQPGVEYRASYHSTVGRYAVNLNALANPVTNGPLSTPAKGGIYLYGTDFPANLSSHNYWVDVFFVPAG